MKRRRINPAKSLKVVAKPSDVRRFLNHLSVELVPTVRRLGACWVWNRCADAAGYGKFKFSGKAVWAHRFSYALFRGAIPDGLEVDHKCRNPTCVNPYHLRRRSRSANAGDNRRRPRAEELEAAPF